MRKKRAKVLIFESIEKFSLAKHNKLVEFREIPHKNCKGYFLSEKGDLLHERKNGSYSVVQYKQPVKKLKGRTQKTGFAVDHYFQNGEYKMAKSRAKMMLLTFAGWTFKEVMSFSMYAKDGNNNHCSLKNIDPCTSQEARERHGIPQRRKKIPYIETKKIQKSEKTNKELAKVYKFHPRTITRHRNGQLGNV